MNKEWFNEQLTEIDVPNDEVFAAIHKGIELGKKEVKKKKKKMISRNVALCSSIAAGILIVSGFIFQPITNVLASVPIIGSIYEDFNSEIGKKLESKSLVNKLDKKATDNGVEVTVTSAYYDGNNIGITFKADGNGLSDKLDKSTSPESMYSLQLYDGEEQKQWSGTRGQLKKKGNTYVGAMTLEYPFKELPSNFNLPLTFTYIGGKKGNWSFNVPITQIPFEKMITNAESSSHYGSYSLKMESIIKAEASTILNYQTKLSETEKNDMLKMKVLDDRGNRLSLHQVGHDRATINSEIDKKANYLLIYPEFSRYEFDTIQSLKVNPKSIQSKRFGYQINLHKTQLTHDQFIVEYKITNINKADIRMDIIHNFADMIKLIKTSDVKNDLKGQALYETLKMDSILYPETARVINEDELHFQSIFNIDKKIDFDFKDYSLMIPFGILSLNSKNVKLEPIKIDLHTK